MDDGTWSDFFSKDKMDKNCENEFTILEILPSQVGNAKCSAAHWVHLSPTTLALQLHFPLLSSHSIPVEPSALHSHAEKMICKIILIFKVFYKCSLLTFRIWEIIMSRDTFVTF